MRPKAVRQRRALVPSDINQTGIEALARELLAAGGQAVAAHPLGRLGQTVEVANAVAFLASDDASFMTASELVIDGGYTAQ